MSVELGEKEAKQLLQRVLKGFYLDPKPEIAAAALEVALKHLDFTKGTVFYSFVRIAEDYPEAKAAFAALEPEVGGAIHAKLLEAADNLTMANPVKTPITNPKHLDYLWAEFGVSGNKDAVKRIIEVLDEPDLMRAKLSAYLRSIKRSVQFQRVDEGLKVAQKEALYAKGKILQVSELVELFTRCELPVDYEALMIEGPLDIDFHIVVAVRNGKIRFDELPVELSEEELVGPALKFAAVWSLQTFAAENKHVAELCKTAVKQGTGAGRMHLSA